MEDGKLENILQNNDELKFLKRFFQFIDIIITHRMVEGFLSCIKMNSKSNDYSLYRLCLNVYNILI